MAKDERETIKDLEKTVKARGNVISELESKVKKLEKEVAKTEKLEADLKAAIEEKEKVHKSNVKLSDDIGKMKQENEKLSKSDKSTEGLKEKLSEANELLENTTKLVSDLKKENATKDKKISDLIKSLEYGEGISDELRQRIREIAELKSKVATLTKKTELLKGNYPQTPKAGTVGNSLVKASPLLATTQLDDETRLELHRLDVKEGPSIYLEVKIQKGTCKKARYFT